MLGRRGTWAIPVALAWVLVVSSLGLAGLAAGAIPGAPSAAHGPTDLAPGASSSSTASGSSLFANASSFGLSSVDRVSSAAVAGSTTQPAGITAAQALIAEKQLNASSVFLPRDAPATRPASAPLEPSYLTNPYPTGISDLGLGSNGPYEFNTTSIAAELSFSSFEAYNPGYADWESGPNNMTFQLNTVATNISYPGSTTGEFWIQSVVHFDGTELQFENNIWNFSSSAVYLKAGTLQNYTGTLDSPLYYKYGPACTVSYPFDLDLYNNLTIVWNGTADVPGVYFNYSLSDSSCASSGSYDFVTFNGVTSLTHRPQFQVNGFHYNPTGYLFNDAELDLGGNGDGSNANVVSLDGTASLKWWSSANSAYENVSSAYDYGVDTGETSLGVAATYAGGGGTEYLSQGPSMMYGLWNTTNSTFGPAALPGSITVSVVAPADYGFVFVTNETTFSAEYGVNASRLNFSYAPGDSTGTATMVLPPPAAGDGYVAEVLADGYTTEYTAAITASGTVTPPAVGDAAEFSSPVYLNSAAQAEAFGTSGTTGVSYDAGTTTVTIDDAQAALDPSFRHVNDFGYPTFLLFAEFGLSASVHLNEFTQSASTFTYVTDRVDTVTIPYWTQGYFFNFGTGLFSVDNTSVIGNSALLYGPTETIPIPAVEFWATTGSTVDGLVTGQDSLGAIAENSTDSAFSQVTAGTGAFGAVLLDDVGSSVHTAAAAGLDSEGYSSVAVYVDGGSDLSIGSVSASDDAIGVYGGSATAVTIAGDSVTTGSEAVDLEELDGLVIDDLSAASASAGGLVALSDSVTLSGVSVSASDEVEVSEGDGVHAIDVSASDGTLAALVVLDSDDTTVANVSAAGNSIGYVGLDGDDAVVTNSTASGLSVGVLVEDLDEVTVSDVRASSGSTGAALAGDELVSVSGFNASETALSGNYFTTAGGSGPFPTTAVATLEDVDATVRNGTALTYNFGLWDNDTDVLSVSNFSEWNGGVGLQLTRTESATIDGVFLFGNALGANLTDTDAVVLTASTVESSAGYGVSVTGGEDATVSANNFVANNGASTNGTTNPAHLQAAVSGAPDVVFDEGAIGNYWSDWSGTGSYAIASGIADDHPYSAFLANWLEFREVGLPAGTTWGFTLTTVPYSTPAELVYIPSWSLPSASLGFVVDPPVGYTPTPPSGAVDFTGANQTVTISFVAVPFTTTFVESGLPSDTVWSVTFNGTAKTNTTFGGSGTISFVTLVGTYAYSIPSVDGYAASSPSGSVYADRNQSLPIAFAIPATTTYAVTFTESGLPAGANWSVRVGATTLHSAGPPIVFELANGTYSYRVTGSAGYAADHASGSVEVNGAPVSVTVPFSKSTSLPGGLSAAEWAAIAVAVVVLVGLGVVLATRRKKSPPTGSPPGPLTEYSPGPAPPSSSPVPPPPPPPGAS